MTLFLELFQSLKENNLFKKNTFAKPKLTFGIKGILVFKHLS